MLTVDTPVAGPRLRDVRNGLTIPPSLSLRTFAEGALHPAWWFDLLTTEPLEFASLHRFEGTVAELVGRMFDPAATMADLAWLRAAWAGPLVVKGIQTVADARAVVDAGADAVVVSNHGGRQLDRAPAPLEAAARGRRRGRRPGRGVRRRRHPVRQRRRRRRRPRGARAASSAAPTSTG